jgi:hypothetical protein
LEVGDGELVDENNKYFLFANYKDLELPIAIK